MPDPVPTILVTGATARDREAAIAARLSRLAAATAEPVSTMGSHPDMDTASTLPAAAPVSISAGPGSHPDTGTNSTAPASRTVLPVDAVTAAAASTVTVATNIAVLLEGLADPTAALAADAAGAQVVRIAPGCLCCAGNLVLRVTLNRLLRRPPARLFIGLADATHVGQLRAMLSAPPYDTLLSLCDDVAAPVVP